MPRQGQVNASEACLVLWSWALAAHFKTNEATGDNAPSAPRIDLTYGLLRVASLGAGVSYAFLSLDDGEARSKVLSAFGVFVAYSLLVYVGGLPLLRGPKNWLFYLLTGVLDYAFVGALMGITGGAASPFYRALYVWVAMLSFYFGLPGGIAASMAALAMFAAFHLASEFAGDRWLLVVQAGGMLLHGPFVGFVSDRLADARRRGLHEQAAFLRAERLSSVGVLAAGVAHEINNPLAGIMSALKALREQTVPEARRDEYYAVALEGLDRIRDAVRGLLDFARPKSPTASTLMLREIVDACERLVAPVAEAKRLQLENRVSSELRVVADSSLVKQALLNLLMNACQASPPDRAVVVGADQVERRIGLKVSDSGSGIPPDQLPRVFDPFFTTKAEGEGTGLGLTVTLNIARSLGGDVSIESVSGKGTTATLWLPSPV